MEKDNLLNDIEEIIETVYEQFQYDFRLYSRSSIRRRLDQVIIKYHFKNLGEVKKALLTDADFFPKLLSYMTVNTTEMFRDPSYFKSLKDNVIPYLKTFPSIKVWVAGCSTGEEVYSLAILFKEAGIKKYLLYASDINPMNLERAEKGIYDITAVQKASHNYQLAGGESGLSDYYQAAYNSVQFDKELIKNVVFSDHSLATDTVFSEMHLISCRNVLIYFEKELQNRVFNLFKDSLIREGFLGLGSKETLQFSTSKDFFNVIDNENKIYQKNSRI